MVQILGKDLGGRWQKSSPRDADPKATLDTLQAVRSMLPSALAEYVQSNKSKQFTWATYWKAFKMARALHKAPAAPADLPSFL